MVAIPVRHAGNLPKSVLGSFYYMSSLTAALRVGSEVSRFPLPKCRVVRERKAWRTYLVVSFVVGMQHFASMNWQTLRSIATTSQLSPLEHSSTAPYATGCATSTAVPVVQLRQISWRNLRLCGWTLRYGAEYSIDSMGQWQHNPEGRHVRLNIEVPMIWSDWSPFSWRHATEEELEGGL
jgi:hypothetical protein